MKRSLIVVGLVAIVAGGFAWHGRSAARATAQDKTPATAPTTSPTPLGVEEFMKNVDQHKGPVTVEGVVSAVSSDKQMVSLIDRHEFEECGMAACAEYTLPVRWSGTMPAVKDAVLANGEVRDSNGKLLFVASSLDKASKTPDSK